MSDQPDTTVDDHVYDPDADHAFPDERSGKIDVRFHAVDQSSYRLLISDNGIGAPENIDVSSSESLGLRIVHVLIKQLDGSLEVDQESGLAYTIEFASHGEEK